MFDGLARSIDASLVPGTTSIGIIPRNLNGKVLVVEPAGHYGGVSATFPKVRMQPGENCTRALLRCVSEKVGAEPETVYPVPGNWSTPGSESQFFTGLLLCSGEVTGLSSPYVASTRWCSVEEAAHRIQASANPPSRERDLALLATAVQVPVFAGRYLLLMLQELHRRGFQRLRAECYIYALGTWRCQIIPYSCLHPSHGVPSAGFGLEELFAAAGRSTDGYGYSIAQGQRYFLWQDAAFDTPAQIADRFLERYREIAFAGWGSDPDYARWLDTTLAATAPNGVFYTFGPDEGPGPFLYTMFPNIGRLPLPPGPVPLTPVD